MDLVPPVFPNIVSAGKPSFGRQISLCPEEHSAKILGCGILAIFDNCSHFLSVYCFVFYRLDQERVGMTCSV